MNTFWEHHQNSIKFGYGRFDCIVLNGLIQPFQQPERVIGFFSAYRQGERVTRKRLGDIAQQFQNWAKNRCQKWGTPMLDAPEEGVMTLSTPLKWREFLWKSGSRFSRSCRSHLNNSKSSKNAVTFSWPLLRRVAGQ